MSNFKDYLEKQLEEQEFKKEWDALELEFENLQTMLNEDKKDRMSQ